MNDWHSGQGYRYEVITIRVIWVAFALSLLVHVAALWTSPPLVRSPTFDPSERTAPAPSLVARLAPRVGPVDTSPPVALASPPPQGSPPSPRPPAPRPPRQAPRPPVAAPAPPPRIARSEPAPGPVPAPPTPPIDAPAGPSVPGDLSAYIAARRRARGESTAAGAQGNAPSAPPVESEQERLNRVVAANLGLNRTPTFGSDPKRGGGVFELRHVGSDDAEFYFNGWDPDIKRIARQRIEVRKGANADIRLAVIRRMIDIIRQQEPGDFIWVSRRLGRQVALSARPADNAGLEDFMMQEFFGDGRAP